jgi:hypothetical protein
VSHFARPFARERDARTEQARLGPQDGPPAAGPLVREPTSRSANQAPLTYVRRSQGVAFDLEAQRRGRVQRANEVEGLRDDDRALDANTSRARAIVS